MRFAKTVRRGQRGGSNVLGAAFVHAHETDRLQRSRDWEKRQESLATPRGKALREATEDATGKWSRRVGTGLRAMGAAALTALAIESRGNPLLVGAAGAALYAAVKAAFQKNDPERMKAALRRYAEEWFPQESGGYRRAWTQTAAGVCMAIREQGMDLAGAKGDIDAVLQGLPAGDAGRSADPEAWRSLCMGQPFDVQDAYREAQRRLTKPRTPAKSPAKSPARSPAAKTRRRRQH